MTLLKYRIIKTGEIVNAMPNGREGIDFEVILETVDSDRYMKIIKDENESEEK